MLPTMTIPSVTLPEPAAPAAPVDAEGGGDAFAQMLQRAQVEPDAAASAEPRTAAPQGHDARTKATRQADAPNKPTRPADARTDDTHGAQDPTALDPLTAALAADATGDACDTAVRGATARTDGVKDDATPATELVVITDTVLMPQLPLDVRTRHAQPIDTAPVDDSGAAELRGLSRLNGRAPITDARATANASAHAPRYADSARDAAAQGALTQPNTATPRQADDAALLQAASARIAPLSPRHGVDGALPLTAAQAQTNAIPASALHGDDHHLPEGLLRTPVDHSGFDRALGAQVALWVRDGVQEARLQLNPAEMGPISVQIALDGTMAHVDFSAAAAATRASIEQSLPALAAALRESGFTLAGGGVSGQAAQQHGEGQRHRGPEGRGGRHGVAGASGTDEAVAPRPWTRSLLDVYA